MGEESRQPSAAQQILAKVKANRDSVYIGRVPPKTKADFITFAEQEFCGDYGMALKWLMDGIPGQDIQAVVAKLEEHETRIIALETALASKAEGKPEEKKTIKMLDGKKVVKV